MDKLGVIVLTTSFRFLVALVEVNKPAGSDFCSKVTCAHALMGNTNKHSKEEGNEPNKPEKKFFLAWLFIGRSASYNCSVIQYLISSLNFWEPPSKRSRRMSLYQIHIHLPLPAFLLVPPGSLA